jgi:hypothetical protein
MPAGPQSGSTVIFVPIPVASVDYGRRQYPDRVSHSGKTKSQPWRPDRQPIPRPQVDRELIERMKEIARRHVEAHRDTIKALLGHAM